MAAENTSTATFLTTEQSRQADKWLVAASVLMGTFLSVMDVSVVNVAIPHMMGSFGQDLLTITWVSTAYSIAEIIMITMTAFWSTLLGRKRLFLASMAIFIVGSVLAGTSRTFGEMLFYRVLQGAGGGTLIPASQAIVREKFPPSEQGMAMAIYGMGVMLAPTLGPLIGGWLVDNWGWRWIFFVNVPFAVVGIVMVSALVQDPPYLKRGIERIDWIGIALLAVGLTALQIVLERGHEVDWFSSLAIVTLGVGFWNFVPLLVETGVGVGCSTVILSTVSLSSMPPESMTEAAGLYTLVRRVSANIAYAVLATLVERHSQLHRAELVGNLNSLGTSFYQYESRANARLMSRGYNSVTWGRRGIAIVDGVLNRQSTMMAYNDVFTLLSWFFVFALPLTLLLPKEGIPPEGATPTE